MRKFPRGFKLAHMTRMPIAGAVPTWTVGDRLRKAREFAELTQDELAAEIGVSRRSISSYESGSPVKRSALIVWALRTGVSLAWLETGIEQAPPGDDGGGLPAVPSAGIEPATYRLEGGTLGAVIIPLPEPTDRRDGVAA